MHVALLAAASPRVICLCVIIMSGGLQKTRKTSTATDLEPPAAEPNKQAVGSKRKPKSGLSIPSVAAEAARQPTTLKKRKKVPATEPPQESHNIVGNETSCSAAAEIESKKPKRKYSWTSCMLWLL